MTDSALVLRADALRLPLPDESVDLIVTSPPYFSLRSYRDDGEHYDGQIGSEPTPQAFLEALWAATAECWRVLKPSGSMFVNLGDKRSGSGAPGSTSGLGGQPQGNRTGISVTRGYNQAAFGRAKSKMLLPHRYAIGCEDGLADPEGLGWIVRQDLVWSKPNGLPESVRDRTRDAHEYWFHLTKSGDYFAAIDELRDAPSGYHGDAVRIPEIPGQRRRAMQHTSSPLGALPRSVWEIPTEPLTVPDHLGVDHFAAFPSEWPRRLILGWSPSGICVECGSERRPVVGIAHDLYRAAGATGRAKRQDIGGTHGGNGMNGAGYPQTRTAATITGYVCACAPFTDHPERRRGDNNAASRDGSRSRSGFDGGAKEWAEYQAKNPGPVREYHLEGWTPPPTRPAVVLDPFGGTGTTAMVARALGRIGVSVDLSADYCKLARWRIFESNGAAKVAARVNRDRQGVLL